ncbi:hypothetical protein ONZ45_g18754 [Pleurotus djamor]|nr:hypothetical protein ONZ45_g18754 [Pleurotus djamor]
MDHPQYLPSEFPPQPNYAFFDPESHLNTAHLNTAHLNTAHPDTSSWFNHDNLPAPPLDAALYHMAQELAASKASYAALNEAHSQAHIELARSTWTIRELQATIKRFTDARSKDALQMDAMKQSLKEAKETNFNNSHVAETRLRVLEKTLNKLYNSMHGQVVGAEARREALERENQRLKDQLDEASHELSTKTLELDLLIAERDQAKSAQSATKPLEA